MSHPPRSRRPTSSSRRAFTLVELTISMMILAGMSFVLGNLSLAIHASWEHVRNLEEARLEAQAALRRIDLMVGDAGVYRLANRPAPTIGLRVLSRVVSGKSLPDTLVVWSGGNLGGQRAQGQLARLPLVKELVVYTTDPADPSRLVEMTFPNNSTPIDFGAANFATTVESLRAAASAVKATLATRVRVVSPAGGNGSAVGQVRFRLTQSPTDEQLNAADTKAKWLALPWSQNQRSGETGVRAAWLRTELQLYARRMPDGVAARAAQPVDAAQTFFGSTVREYVHEP